MEMSRQESFPNREESLVTIENLVVVDCVGLVNQLRIHDGIETLTELPSQWVARLENETMR